MLSLGGLKLTEEVFMLGEKLLELRVLDLAGCAGLEKENCVRALMAAAPNITNITLAGCDITVAGVLYFLHNVNPKVQCRCFQRMFWLID